MCATKGNRIGEVYTPAAQGWWGDATDLDCAGCGAESDPKKNFGCPAIYAHIHSLERDRVQTIPTLEYDIAQCFTVTWVLGNGLAVIPRLTRPIIDCHGEVMCRDRARYCTPERLDGFDRRPSCCVLEYDA